MCSDLVMLLRSCDVCSLSRNPHQVGTVACPSCDRLFHAKCAEREMLEQRRRQEQGTPPSGSGLSKWWLDHLTNTDGAGFVCSQVLMVVARVSP